MYLLRRDSRMNPPLIIAQYNSSEKNTCGQINLHLAYCYIHCVIPEWAIIMVYKKFLKKTE
jgi:hypothetical protein